MFGKVQGQPVKIRIQDQYCNEQYSRNADITNNQRWNGLLPGLTKGKNYGWLSGIIFHFLWDLWAYCGIFENGVLLMYMLVGISSVANFLTAYEESQ